MKNKLILITGGSSGIGKAAAMVIANTVKTRKAIVIKPITMTVFVFLNRLFPGMLRWLLRITGYKYNVNDTSN